MQQNEVYKPQNHIRVVTAASLFDGHDATINVMRRILQASGAEVIHLGHDRSVTEIVNTAIQEDVQAVAITSYQGGHMEYFKYMRDLLNERDCEHIKIFGGGGGVILPDEIEELQAYGIERIYSPDDGRRMGLQGMINDVLMKSDFPSGDIQKVKSENILLGEQRALAATITAIENGNPKTKELINALQIKCEDLVVPVIGLTGTGGSGKSSIIDELVRRFKVFNPEIRIAIISVDPTKRKTGGALLGDRIRMNSINQPGIFMRSMATRQANLSLSKFISETVCLVKKAGYDLVILESSGIGQSDTEIVDYSDLSMYIMTPEFGAATQLEKIGMLDYADVIAINKFDRRGALDALRDVKKQFIRNHGLWDVVMEELPVFGTMASQFNDTGVNELYTHLVEKLNTRYGFSWKSVPSDQPVQDRQLIIPSKRVRYLSEIAETVREYNKYTERMSETASRLQAYTQTAEKLSQSGESLSNLDSLIEEAREELGKENIRHIENWEGLRKRYKDPEYIFRVRGKDIRVKTHSTSLSHTEIPKVTLPSYKGWGDILKWKLRENIPGCFPYAAGVYPFKRENEDPTRMFAGEGSPERTNKRFHYLSKGMPARRLSTAFDSVTLYGADPDVRPDIYGKVGNAGVSVSCLDDAKKLYSGFNLLDTATSVSMTINGPAPALVGFFLNTAIDQQCEEYIKENALEAVVEKKIAGIYSSRGITRPVYNGPLPEGNNGLGLMLLGVTGDMVLEREVYERIKADTISKVRGTVQADILKEDQAQNTCIFSTDFSLRAMGDMQEYFIDNKVNNFYSVSISGYHIAEAGANPITQLAFTLANGFTYVEYYLSRGLKIDDFAPNFSFFFSNGVDPEYAVMGRVARLIWAKAMKLKYGANERSQMLKYHIQTSGRSLHAQEIAFNDIRTTLQALYAIYDNCNSLHTNAYDEAITTPTEESVRRAMAIQLIINHELGLAKNQNPLQGSFIIEELTDLVEEAVLKEFEQISDRGGVLGAMESMYQRSRIQEESLYYEQLKHEGKLPIMGVNTFLSSEGSPTIIPETVIRSTTQEKDQQVEMVKNVKAIWHNEAETALSALALTAASGGNVFESLMEATKYCTLGSITGELFSVGGQYRRNM